MGLRERKRKRKKEKRERGGGIIGVALEMGQNASHSDCRVRSGLGKSLRGKGKLRGKLKEYLSEYLYYIYRFIQVRGIASNTCVKIKQITFLCILDDFIYFKYLKHRVIIIFQ